MAGSNTFKFGLSNLRVAEITVTAGVYSYGTLTPWPGAISMTATPKGDIEPIEADNTDYKVLDKSEGYDIELETLEIPEAVADIILDRTEDTKKVATEYVGKTYPAFALVGQINGDQYNSRFEFMDCVVVARPEIAAKTSKSKNPDNFKIKLRARPRTSDNLVMMSTQSDTDATVYANWFTAVTEPTA
ncbi:MAG: major tail protein [Christensenella sp.]|nr:major tail protein [Christensenella sp.]